MNIYPDGRTDERTHGRIGVNLIRWVPLVEQELPTDQEHLHSPPILSGGRVT
jgi:hypothetical protein